MPEIPHEFERPDEDEIEIVLEIVLEIESGPIAWLARGLFSDYLIEQQRKQVRTLDIMLSTQTLVV